MLKKDELKIGDIVVVFNRAIEDFQIKEYRITDMHDGRITLNNGLEFMQDTLLDVNVGTRMLFLGGKNEYIHYIKKQRELINDLDKKIIGQVDEMKTLCRALSSCCVRLNALNRTGNVLRSVKNTEIKRLNKSVSQLKKNKETILSLLLMLDNKIKNIDNAVGEYITVNNLIEAGKTVSWSTGRKNIYQMKEVINEMQELHDSINRVGVYNSVRTEIKNLIKSHDFKQQKTAET